jgi:quinol monooxygenase YgiN
VSESGQKNGYGGCTIRLKRPEMILASLCFRARPHKRAELLSAVDVTVERMRSIPACERCRLLVDTEDPNAFTLTSEWHSASDAEAFFESREFQIFKGIRILLRDEPVIVLDEIGSRITRLIPGR